MGGLSFKAKIRRTLQRCFSKDHPDSDYLKYRFLRHIDKDSVSTIFELGSRDGQDAILLRNYFNAQVTTFECNPNAIQTCRKNLNGQKHITLVETAAWDRNTEISFYPVFDSTWYDGTPILDASGNNHVNVGASSCFRARPDYVQRYIQSETTVPAIRLDHYCQDNGIDTVDLLCIDVQGAALQALVGLGNYIDRVRYIIVELENREIYFDQSLYEKTNDYLASQGFYVAERIYRDAWFCDYLYLRCEE